MPRLTTRPSLQMLLRRGVNRSAMFLAWWVAELGSLIPPPVKSFFSDRRADVLMRRVGDDLIFATACGKEIARVSSEGAAALPTEVATAVRDAGAVTAVLPRSSVLRRTIELPVAVTAELAAAMSFEIDRQTPFSADQVHSTFRIIGRDAVKKIIQVELAVAPRSTVEDVLQRAAAHALTVDAVTVDGDALEPPLDFLGRERGTRARAWRAEPWKPLLAASLMLFVVGLGGVAWTLHATAASLAAEVAAKRQTAEHAEALKSELDAAERVAGFLPAKLAAPRAIDLLDTLSKTVPDDSWLFSLQINGKEIHLTGLSGNVPALIERLETLSGFEAPQYRAPVIHRTDDAKDRFDLTLGLKRNAT